jgi:hypothetical protein
MSWKVICCLLDICECFVAIGGDGDCLVVKVEVTSILVGPNVGPQELCVKDISVDKGGEDMEVVFSGMKPNEYCSIDGSQSEDNCSG